MTFFQLDYAAVALAVVEVILGVAVLIVAKLALGILSPYSTDQEMTTKDNPAFGLAISSYFAGVVIVYLSIAALEPLPLDDGAKAVALAMGAKLAWALGGIVALNLSRWLMDRLLVPHVRNDREISEHRNLAAGALEGGAYIASAAVLAGAIRQPGGDLWTVLGTFLLAQFVLILLGRLYQRWTGYNVAAEIGSGNFAAGTAFAMTMAALSLLMVKAVSGEFISWTRNLSFFAFDSIAGLILLLFLRWLTAATLLPHARLTEEIVRDRNVNVSLIEGVFAVGIAAIILLLF
jgi:uncharacterized membrane protein YjfL (UPF0719 family)